MKAKLTCGSLFSGIGGFCIGFEQAGFVTSWAIDNDPQVATVYTHNFPLTKFILDDITKVDFDDLTPVEVIHAGFPCQSFSQAGNKLGFDDPRGQLFIEMMIKIRVASWKPSILVFENTSFLRSGANGEWYAEVKRQIKKSGFWFDDQNVLLLSTNKIAGLPQKRERLFLIATNKQVFGHNPFVGLTASATAKSNIDLLDLNELPDEKYFLSEDNRYGAWLLKESEKLQRGQLIQLRKHIVRPQRVNECPTLTANMGLGGHNVPFLVHNGRLRKMTERECLRMQGFPDSFQFPEISSGAQYRMIGNAVSPPIAERLAVEIAQEIKTRFEMKENGYECRLAI